MLEVPEALLEERRRTGADRRDELWEGVLHMVPPPTAEHQSMSGCLYLQLGPAAQRRGLRPFFETGLFAAQDDFRVPDLLVARPEHVAHRGVDATAVLVVEILSAGDESYEKLPWYAARAVDEIVIVDLGSRRVELYTSRNGAAQPVDSATGGAITLQTVGARLLTVGTPDGPRLRVEVDGATTDC